MKLTPARKKALTLAAETGKPYPRANYRHNNLEWQMWQNMIADGLLKKDLSITAKGRKALSA